MFLPTRLLLMGSALLVLSGCASADRSGRRIHAHDPEVFRERTGFVTESDLFDRLPRVLARHGFFIVEADGDSQFFFLKTQWHERVPFEDERTRGAVMARTRLSFRAVRNGRMYSLTLEAHRMIETSSSEDWVPTPIYAEAMAYLEEIASELRLELASGIRRF